MVSSLFVFLLLSRHLSALLNSHEDLMHIKIYSIRLNDLGFRSFLVSLERERRVDEKVTFLCFLSCRSLLLLPLVVDFIASPGTTVLPETRGS